MTNLGCNTFLMACCASMKRKDINLTEDASQSVLVCLFATSILGEFQRGDPVTDPPPYRT